MAQSVLTPEIQALVGVAGDVVEGWGVVDEEYLRRFHMAVPDPDPRYWEEEFARKSSFKKRVSPPMMAYHCATRKAPFEDEEMDKLMMSNPMSDGSGASYSDRGRLPKLPTRLDRVLHVQDEIEILKCAELGDKLYYQNRYHAIEERVGKDGKPFLLVTVERRIWNQDNETLALVRATTVHR